MPVSSADTLGYEVEVRYDAQLLIGLTNPNNRAAASVNATTLGYAVTDVEADFEIIAGVQYANDDKRHVNVAIEGVIAKLSMRMNQAGERSKNLVDEYLGRLEQLAMVTGRDRLLPLSKSELTPSDEAPDGGTKVRPKFDGSRFWRLKPNGPPAGERDVSLITNT